MAGARALWRATGMTDDDFGKPIVAIANSYTQFVPGHVHLKDLGGIVADAIAEAGASTQKDMGQVMKIAMARVDGRADGKRVSARVREALTS